MNNYPPQAWVFVSPDHQTSDVVYLAEDRVKQAAVCRFLNDGISYAPFEWHPKSGLMREQELYHNAKPTGWRVYVQIWADVQPPVFKLIDNPPPEDGTGEPSYMDSCDCKHTGSQLPVLLSLDDGSISIICAICRRSFLFLDDLAGVSLDEIPMTLTYHDTTHHYPEVEYDGYWQLTSRETDQATDGAV